MNQQNAQNDGKRLTPLQDENDNMVNVPDDVYNSTLNVDVEPWLQELIDDVIENHEKESSSTENETKEVKRDISVFWDKIYPILKDQFKIKKFALLNADVSGNFSVENIHGFNEKIKDYFNIAYNEVLLTDFINKKKAVRVVENIFKSKLIASLYRYENKSDVEEMYFFPIHKYDNIIGILNLSIDKDTKHISKELILKTVMEKCEQLCKE